MDKADIRAEGQNLFADHNLDNLAVEDTIAAADTVETDIHLD